MSGLFPFARCQPTRFPCPASLEFHPIGLQFAKSSSVRLFLRISTGVFFAVAAAFFLWGLFHSVVVQGWSQGMPFQIGYGVALISIVLMVILLWGSWRSTPPTDSGSGR